MRSNTKIKKEPVFTHGNAKAASISAEKQLERSVMSCLLFENEFYEDGEDIFTRILDLATNKVPSNKVAALALKARTEGNLRHVPLVLTLALAKKGYEGTAKAIEQVIQRPDEMGELLALYWKDDKNQPLSNQIKKGLARAFEKFNTYSLSKYRGLDREISLRDVMFLVHPNPPTKELAKLYKKLANNKLEAAETWEKKASSGESQDKVFTKLIKNKELGALAMLRNLRNMKASGVSDDVIKLGLKNMNVERVLPFRFITAAKYAPEFEPELEEAMFKVLHGMPKLKGKTILIEDVSGSMGCPLSSKSEMSRIDAAAALAVLAREVCEEVKIYATAGNDGTRIHKTGLLPARHGFALIEAFHKAESQLGGGGIFLTQVMDYVFDKEKDADRIIVFTDEQDTSGRLYNPATANAFGDENYLVNIASAQNGIGYGPKWNHIDGFSSAIIDWIYQYENLN